MEKEEQIFRNRIQELAQLCYRKEVPVNTDFLTLNEQTIFQNISGTLPPVRFVLSGGSSVSERKVVCFLPSYADEQTDPPYDCLRISPQNRRFAEELSHRDYLGAIMNLGIERAVIGDIIIRDGDAYVFVMKKISRYLQDNLNMVRHTTVEAVVCEDTGCAPEPEFEEISGTVSSLRLDSMVALAGRLSRTKAVEYITSERVLVNGKVMISASRLLKEGEILSVRGIGKFLFSHIGGQTKKGRTPVTLMKYK